MKCHFSLCNIFSESSLPRACIPYNAHGIRKMQKLKEIRKLNYITCTKFVGCVISWKTACFTMYYTCNLKKLVCLIYRVRILCQGLDCRQMMKGLVEAVLNINIDSPNNFLIDPKFTKAESIYNRPKNQLFKNTPYDINYFTVHINLNAVVKILTLNFLATCNFTKRRTD